MSNKRVQKMFDRFMNGNPPFANNTFRDQAQAFVDYFQPQIEKIILEEKIGEIKNIFAPSIEQAANRLKEPVPKTWEAAYERGLTPMIADARIKELTAEMKKYES